MMWIYCAFLPKVSFPLFKFAKVDQKFLKQQTPSQPTEIVAKLCGHIKWSSLISKNQPQTFVYNFANSPTAVTFKAGEETRIIYGRICSAISNETMKDNLNASAQVINAVNWSVFKKVNCSSRWRRFQTWNIDIRNVRNVTWRGVIARNYNYLQIDLDYWQ